MSNKSKKRGIRRHKTKAVQEKRVHERLVTTGWKMNDRQKGKAKKSNFSCGCILCKPWKHGRGTPR